MHSTKKQRHILVICLLCEENTIMEILMYPIIGILALLGAGSSIVIITYLFIVIAQKIKNKILHGTSFYK